jgi:hypothetical protein
MHNNGTATKPATFDGTLSASEIMPHSEEAETAVLGSVLIDPDAFYDVDLIVSPGDFYSHQRGQVYQADEDENGVFQWVLVPFPAFLQSYVTMGAAAPIPQDPGKRS